MNERGILFLDDLLKTEQLDGLLFFSLPNIRYLSGFTGTDGVFFYRSNETCFLTDSRYIEQAKVQVKADRILCYRDKLQAISELLAETALGKVGFEAEIVTVALYERLRKLSAAIDWRPLSRQLKSLRAVKSAEELRLLRRAAELNRQAFEAVLPLIKVGISEHDVALELEFTLKRLGGEANAFDFIVASGARGALPHGVASDKRLAGGELLTVDFGTRVEGYHSDETVTLAIGQIDGNLRQIFDIVLEAHDLAIKVLQPGMALAELDAVARDFINRKGFGSNFGHGLGHGVGLEIHEYPGVSPQAVDTLVEGMVVTVEPGVYLPGRGGVRIEDTVVVTATGCELLTSIPKTFRQI